MLRALGHKRQTFILPTLHLSQAEVYSKHLSCPSYTQVTLSPFSEAVNSEGGWGQDKAVSPRCSFLLALFLLCASMGPPQASVPSGVCCFCPQNTFYSSDFGVPCITSLLFPPLSPCHFLPFAKLGMPPASLRGSAMSYGGCVAEMAEMGCVCHRAALGLFSQR